VKTSAWTAAGNISLVNALDHETATSYTLTLNASDGVNTTSSDLIITVDDVNEAPSLSNTLAASSFAENCFNWNYHCNCFSIRS
jgi:hypothetical protein